MILFDTIKNNKILLEDARANWNRFIADLAEIKKKRNPKRKSNEQKNALYNINMLYKSREAVIKFYDDYSSMISGSLYKSNKQKGLKILSKCHEDYQ